MNLKLNEIEKTLRKAKNGGYECLIIINGEYYGVEEWISQSADLKCSIQAQSWARDTDTTAKIVKQIFVYDSRNLNLDCLGYQ